MAKGASRKPSGKRTPPPRLYRHYAQRFFKGKDAFPAGRLAVNSKGSGYKGSGFTGGKPNAEEKVFHLMCISRHRDKVVGSKTHSWAQPGSIGHTALSIFPEKKAAVITTVQPTVDLKKSFLTRDERARYRNWHLATALAATIYCRKHGLKLYAVRPKNYRDIHLQTGSMSPDIPRAFKKTLDRLAEGFKIKLKEVETEKAIGQENNKFFGSELLRLL